MGREEMVTNDCYLATELASHTLPLSHGTCNKTRKPRAFAIAVASNRAQKAVKLPSALAPFQVCPLCCRSRFTPSHFMALPKAATLSSARRSQIAGAVVA